MTVLPDRCPKCGKFSPVKRVWRGEVRVEVADCAC